MRRSDNINEISAALAKAQAKMGAAVKDSTNPHFRSKYADLAAVVDAVRGPLSENGISYTQWPEAAEGGVCVVTVLSHSSGQWMDGETFIPVSKSDAQGYGSAITYGKRYGLQSACGVPSDDDDGNAAAAAPPREAIHPHNGVWEGIAEDERAYLIGVATHCSGLLAAGDVAGAMDYIHAQKLDADLRVALNTRFDSKQRAAMKRYHDEQKKVPPEVKP